MESDNIALRKILLVNKKWLIKTSSGKIARALNKKKYIKVTSGYLFNKSHAAAYADLGYRTMYLKVKYPMQFWETSFSYASEDKIAGYIAEINKTGDIKITPPEINTSDVNFKADFGNNSIRWSISSIKQPD